MNRVYGQYARGNPEGGGELIKKYINLCKGGIKYLIIIENIAFLISLLTPWLIETRGSMPHSLGLSNNPYPSRINPTSHIDNYFFKIHPNIVILLLSTTSRFWEEKKKNGSQFLFKKFHAFFQRNTTT